jgi:hypothetical protein
MPPTPLASGDDDPVGRAVARAGDPLVVVVAPDAGPSDLPPPALATL